MLTYTYMLRFFIASRLASGRDLFFEIACTNVSDTPGLILVYYVRQSCPEQKVKEQSREDFIMKQRGANFSLIVVLLLCAVAGSMLVSCATVSRDVRREAATDLTFPDLRRNPDQYLGETAILGGYILETRNFEEETRLLVIQAPLSVREEPKDRDLSEGRFILVYDGFLDPEIYERDRKITVAGEVLGSEESRIDGRRYVMPMLRIREIHLWADPREFHYHESFYYPWGYPWGYPHFRYRPYPYRW